MKPELKPLGTKRLKLNCDILLSTSALKFNLRRYTVGRADVCERGVNRTAGGRGFHPSTYQLNLSHFGRLNPRRFGQCAVLCAVCDEI
jgi:hypothetical protein